MPTINIVMPVIGNSANNVDSLLCITWSEMELFLIIIIVLAAILLFVVLGKSKILTLSSSAAYRLNGTLFSPAERSFFGVLSQAVPDENLVLGKVRVADIITPQKGLSRSRWQSAFNRISAKHFDYIICDRATLKVLSAVELNDKSHKGKKRADRDAFLREACSSAGLRLFEFEAKSSYSVVEVRKQLAYEVSNA